MVYLLRAIYKNAKWEKEHFPGWLHEGELPSCVVRDLRADDNALSLWEISEEEGTKKEDIKQVVTALASSRKTFKDDFDFALLNKEYINEITFQCLPVVGNTPYTSVNSKYHRDLCNLSINTLIYFAFLLQKNARFDRLGWKTVRDSLLNAFINNKLDLKQVPIELKQSLVLYAAKQDSLQLDKMNAESKKETVEILKGLVTGNKVTLEQLTEELRQEIAK